MSSKNKEKSWVVYSTFYGPLGIGMIFREPNNNSVYLLYSEGQLFMPNSWDSEYAKFFSTSKEAIDFFILRNHKYSRNELVTKVIESFPKACKKEELQFLHDLLDSYKNKLNAQSSPKCIEEDYIEESPLPFPKIHPIDMEGYFPRD